MYWGSSSSPAFKAKALHRWKNKEKEKTEQEQQTTGDCKNMCGVIKHTHNSILNEYKDFFFFIAHNIWPEKAQTLDEEEFSFYVGSACVHARYQKKYPLKCVKKEKKKRAFSSSLIGGRM